MRLFRITFIYAFLAVLALPASGQQREGYVLRVQGRLVFIDLGEQDNVQPGSVYQIARQETIIHPVTGENLGGTVPLGAIRIVQVMPRLSTAEVVDLARGLSMEALDQEAKQGLIRVQPMPEEMAATLQKRLESAAPGMSPMQAAQTVSADGRIGAWVPTLQFNFGSAAKTAAPDSIQNLLRPGSRASVADTALAPLGNVSGSRDIGFSLLYPVSEKLSVFGEIHTGSRSLVAVGGRYFLGKRLWGSGRSADGLVGEPVFTLAVGSGGRGKTALPQAVLDRITARSDAAFLESLNSEFVVEPVSDSLQAVITDTLNDITNALRAEAADSFSAVSKRSPGFALGLTLPMSQKWTLRMELTRFGNISEFSGGLTYYMKASEPGTEGSNPDGALKSLVLALDGTYDTKGKETYLHLNLKYPIAPRYTIGADLLTNMGGFSRFGLSLKGYIKGR